MDYEKYVELLSTCNVGIYYNDRQQGMGNINTLLRLGKKVYLRKGTSMWNNYKKNNFILFDVDELNNIYYNNLIEFN